MGLQFSENIWNELSSLWKKKKEQTNVQLEYHDEQVSHLLKMMFWVRCGLKEKQYFDTEEAWKMVQRRTEERKFVPVWWRYVAAAVVVVGLVCGIWKGFDGMDEMPLAVNVVDSILPGTQRAELILANGEKVILDANTEVHKVVDLGAVITNSAADGTLRYTIDSLKDSEITKYNTLRIPHGGEYVLELPDGSRVWLNSGSTLRFPVRFAATKREVELSGEALFKVRKNSATPFYVRTDNGNIRVLGTTFNVSAYPDDKYWHTTLVEGSVEVARNKRKVLLKPSEQFFINRMTGHEEVLQVETDLYTSWVDGKFYFKAYTFEEIVKKMERWYDFTIVYKDEGVKQKRFTGVVNKHRPITEVLRFLEMTTDIRFKIEGRKIIVDKI